MRGKSTSTAAVLGTAALFSLVLGCTGGPTFNPLPPGSESNPATAAATQEPSPTPLPVATPDDDSANRAEREEFIRKRPAEYLDQIIGNLDRIENVSAEAHFHWPVYVTTGLPVFPGDYTTGGAEGEVVEALVQAEGGFEIPFTTQEPDGSFGKSFPSFHLAYHQQGVDAAGLSPRESQLEVRLGRPAANTTGNGLQVYSSYAEWQRMAPILSWEKQPGIGMFLSLALTGGQVLEYNVLAWLNFEQENVRLADDLGDDGLRMFEAAQPRPNGDFEEWTFWIDDKDLIRRMKLSVTNEHDPALIIRDAEIELTDYAELLPWFR